MKILISDKIGSFVRTGLAGLGGYLIAKGATSPETVELVTNSLVDATTAIVAGVVTYLTAQISSLINKKK